MTHSLIHFCGLILVDFALTAILRRAATSILMHL